MDMEIDPETRASIVGNICPFLDMAAEGEYQIVSNISRGVLTPDEARELFGGRAAELEVLSRSLGEVARIRPIPSYEVTVPLPDGGATDRLVVKFRIDEVYVDLLGIVSLAVMPASVGDHGLTVEDSQNLGGSAEDDHVPQPVPERWRAAVAGVVHRLAIGDYEGLARDAYLNDPEDTDGSRIRRWIDEYPSTLGELPDEAWQHSDHWLVDTDKWWVVMDLWTSDGGRSDLSLEATVEEVDGEPRILVHNVHAM